MGELRVGETGRSGPSAPPRYRTLSEFWPFYLAQHRQPVCRQLHFVGTTGFFVALALAVVREPFLMVIALAAVAVIGGVSSRLVEPHIRAVGPLLVMVAALMVVAPLEIGGGAVWAYAFAWIGHVRIERNRPATFTYPLWSLIADFRMWGAMASGRL